MLLELPTGPWSSKTRRSVPYRLRGALEDVDQVHQGPVQAEDGVLTVQADRVVEEPIADVLILVDE